METNQMKVGLDIGTNKIKVTVGKPNPNGNGRVTLLVAEEEIAQGVVRSNITNIDKTVGAIKKAISKASTQAGMEIKVANVSIAGTHIKSTMHRSGVTRESAESEITVEDIKQLNEEMYRILTAPGYEIVDVVPRGYSVDYQEEMKDPPIGMSGGRIEGTYHVITAQTNAINNIYKCANRVGIEVNKLIVGTLAAGYTVLTEEEKDAGVCLVNIGASIMEFSIYHHGGLQYITTIPFAGEVITKDLAQAFMLMEPQAEILKKNFGAAYEEENTHEVVTIPGLRNRPEKEIPIPVIKRVIEARMEEIIHLIHTQIVSAGFQNKLAGGIVLAGGGAKMALIDKLFQYVTGYDTRLGHSCENLKSKIQKKDPGVEYATSIGLLLANAQPKTYISEQNDQHIGRNTGEKKSEKVSFWGRIKEIF